MKKVLLVCLDNLGDLVFVSGLARALSEDPDVELSLWCKDYTSRIAHLLPGIHKIYAADPFWDRGPQRRRGSLRVFLRSWRSIRRAHFDVAYLPTVNWRTAFFVKLAGIPRRLGLAGRKNQRFLTEVVHQPRSDETVVAGFLRVFGGSLTRSVPPHTWLDRRRLPPLALPLSLQGKKIAVLHAFAGRADRCAPLEVWERLAQQLEAAGYFILWTGTQLELERLRGRLPGSDVAHFIDSWAQDLEKLAWLWAQASLFVGHDSGPLHVAHALGVPVIGLYLPGQKRTFPQSAAPSHLYQASNPAALDLLQLSQGIAGFIEGLAQLTKS